MPFVSSPTSGDKKKPQAYEDGFTDDLDAFSETLRKPMISNLTRRDILSGALAAFDEGRPENLQMILSTYANDRKRKNPSETLCRLAAETLEQVIKRNAAPAITKQLLQDIPIEERRGCLSSLLCDSHQFLAYSVRNKVMILLLDIGIDPAHKDAAGAMAKAIGNTRTEEVVALFNQGISFDAVRRHILLNYNSHGDQETDLKKLENYREALTGQRMGPHTPPAVFNRLAALEQEVTDLKAEIAALKAAQQQARKPLRRKKPHKPAAKPKN